MSFWKTLIKKNRNDIDIAQSNIDELSLITETDEKTSDYTLTLGDEGKVILMNKSGIAIVTVPKNDVSDFPIGTIINIYNVSTDNVDIIGAEDVVIRNAGSVVQYTEASLRKRATNEWVLVGGVE